MPLCAAVHAVTEERMSVRAAAEKLLYSRSNTATAPGNPKQITVLWVGKTQLGRPTVLIVTGTRKSML